MTGFTIDRLLLGSCLDDVYEGESINNEPLKDERVLDILKCAIQICFKGLLIIVTKGIIMHHHRITSI